MPTDPAIDPLVRVDPAQCPCDGTGFRPVGERYVESIAPWTTPPYDPPLTADEQRVNDAIAADDRQRRAAARRSSYPCPVHNSEQYERWARGEWDRRRPPPLPQPHAADPQPQQPTLDDWSQTRRDLQ